MTPGGKAGGQDERQCDQQEKGNKSKRIKYFKMAVMLVLSGNAKSQFVCAHV